MKDSKLLATNSIIILEHPAIQISKLTSIDKLVKDTVSQNIGLAMRLLPAHFEGCGSQSREHQSAWSLRNAWVYARVWGYRWYNVKPQIKQLNFTAAIFIGTPAGKHQGISWGCVSLRGVYSSNRVLKVCCSGADWSRCWGGVQYVSK